MRQLILVVLVGIAAALIVRARSRTPAPTRSGPGAPIGSLEGDRQVLAQLRKAGADLTKPTEVNYYMYFPTQEAADTAAKSAGAGPLAAHVRRAAGDSSWLCLVTGEMVPTEAAIHAHTIRLIAIAESLGGEYDGWEAAVTQ